jgi:hypothetical protein
LCRRLFGDLLPEKIIAPASESLDPMQLALQANLALALGLIRRATDVRLELCGNARSVIR